MLGKFNLFYYLISIKMTITRRYVDMASAPSVAKQGKNAPGRVDNTGAQRRSSAVASNGRGGNRYGSSRGRATQTARRRG